MTEVYALANQFRRQLLRCERAAASEMVRVYGDLWRRLKRQIDAMLQEPDADMLWALRRARELQAQVEIELGRYAAYADMRIQGQQHEAIATAVGHMEQLVFEQMQRAGVAIVWNRLSVTATQRMIGFTANGAPLGRLLTEYGQVAARGMGDALIRGVSLGLSPRETARLMRKEFGMALSRALTVARTETLRAYREASRETMIANSDMIAGWVWVASKSGRTCPACLAMDGTFHRLTERLDDHPNGRCAAIPAVRGAERPSWETGSEWLARQNEETQRKVLGAGYDAYRAGAPLTRWVARRRSRVWGTMRYAKRPSNSD